MHKEELNQKLFKAIEDSKPISEIEALIKQGADVNARDNAEQTPIHLRGGTPLHIAFMLSGESSCTKSFVNIAELLIKHGADVNALNDRKQTPLHMIVDDLYTAELLIAHGADVNSRDIEGKTPLHYNSFLFEILIKHGADVNAKDKYGLNPFAYGLYCGQD